MNNKWTKTTPTEEGYYWWRFNNLSDEYIVKVAISSITDELCVYNGVYASVEMEDYEGEWCGPITRPEE